MPCHKPAIDQLLRLPEVFEAMRLCFCEAWRNPSSAYKFGSKLKGMIESETMRKGSLHG